MNHIVPYVYNEGIIVIVVDQTIGLSSNTFVKHKLIDVIKIISSRTGTGTYVYWYSSLKIYEELK